MVHGHAFSFVFSSKTEKIRVRFGRAEENRPIQPRSPHTFRNSSDGVQTPPKDLYTLDSLPVVYLNPRLAASSLAAVCHYTATLKCTKMSKRIYVRLGGVRSSIKARKPSLTGPGWAELSWAELGWAGLG